MFITNLTAFICKTDAGQDRASVFDKVGVSLNASEPDFTLTKETLKRPSAT